MIEATLNQIRGAVESGALARLASQSLPVKAAYWLGRTIEAAQKEFDRTAKLNIDLYRKYGEEIEGQPDVWKLKEENLAAYGKEFAELLSESVEMIGRKLTLDELSDLKISGADMVWLGWLIDDAEVEPKPAKVTQIKSKKKAAA